MADPRTCIVYTLPALAVLSNLAQIPVPVACGILGVSGSLQARTSGTLTVTVTNDAGSNIATLTWLATGMASVVMGAVSALAANDKLHINVTGIGAGMANCTLTIWLKVPAA